MVKQLVSGYDKQKQASSMEIAAKLHGRRSFPAACSSAWAFQRSARKD